LVTEADALHMAAEIYLGMMHFRHGCTKSGPRPRLNTNLRTARRRFVFARPTGLGTVPSDAARRLHFMTNSDSDGLFDNDWEDRGELSWTEADWMKYLGNQDSAVREYQKLYDQLAAVPDRIDEVARRMGWELTDDEPAPKGETEEVAEAEEVFDGDWDPYTLHRNPVYISTRAIYASLIAQWERVATQPESVPVAMAVTLQASLYRGDEQVLQAVQALEMGDYTLAICLFKQALRELNVTLARLGEPDVAAHDLARRYRDFALPRLFDLREIWLRVMNECRQDHVDDGGLE
jgi:hypothetical protein